MHRRLQWCSEATSGAQWAPTGVLSRTHEVYIDDFSGARRPLPLCMAAPLWALVGRSLSFSLRILLYDNVHASGLNAKDEQLYCRGNVCVPKPRSADLCGGGRPRGGWYVWRQCPIPLAWEGLVAQPVTLSQDFYERVLTSGHLGGTALLC